MITETNHYFGTSQPKEYEYVNGGIMHCTNIHQTDSVWYADITITLEGDDAYAPLKRSLELQATVQEQDALSVGIIEGEIDTTTKARLYARLVHEGKKDYPKEIPAELVQDVYDQYTNYYHYQPPLTPPNEE